MQNLTPPPEEENIDYQRILFLGLSNWKLFLLSILVSLFAALFTLRYSTPVYEAETLLLIKDENSSQIGAAELLESAGIFTDSKNVYNELFVLRSNTIIEDVINKQDITVSYFKEGNIRDVLLYKNSPYLVFPDSGLFLKNDRKYKLESVTDSSYHLKIEDHLLDSTFYTTGFFGKKTIILSDSILILKNKDYFQKGSKIDEQNIVFLIPNRKKQIAGIKDRLEINLIDEYASVVSLKLKGTNPNKITDFLNLLTEVYLKKNLEAKNQVAINTIQFIDDQLSNIADSLSGAEYQLAEFRKQNQLMDLSAEAQRLYTKLELLETEKADLNIKDKYYNYLLEYVESNNQLEDVIAPSAMGIIDPLLQKLIADLDNLYSEKAALGLANQPNHPSIISINGRIQNAKLTLIENVQNIKNNSDIAVKDIDKRIVEVEKKVNTLPENERNLVNIERKFNLNDHIYNYLLEKRAEAGIAKAANAPDHVIIDPAYLTNDKPIAPKKKIYVLIFLFLGIGLVVLFIAIKEFLNDKITSKEELEKRTQTPIIGNIYHVNEDETSNRKVDDCFQNIRINLAYTYAKDREHRVIGVTSSIGGEGKTFTSSHLAKNYAKAGKKTLFIGADMRKPQAQREFDLKKSIGLSDYFIGNLELSEVIEELQENLDVLATGTIPPNPAELLSNYFDLSFLNELKKKYDIIIVDTPPIDLVPDYLVMKNHFDIHLFVTRVNYTKKKIIEDLDDKLSKKGLEHCYILLNDLDTTKPGYYGYSSYDSNYYYE